MEATLAGDVEATTSFQVLSKFHVPFSQPGCPRDPGRVRVLNPVAAPNVIKSGPFGVPGCHFDLEDSGSCLSNGPAWKAQYPRGVQQLNGYSLRVVARLEQLPSVGVQGVLM